MQHLKKTKTALLVGLLSLSGCGGGGDTEVLGAAAPQTIEIFSNAGFDGHVTMFDTGFPTAVETVGDIQIGNSSASALRPISRGFLGFDLSQLPAGAVIDSAELVVYQLATGLGDPYGHLGPGLMVDHIDLGGALREQHFDVAALASGLVLSTNALEGPKQVSVRAAVEADVAAGRTQTRLRLRMQDDLDLSHISNDYTYFASGDSATGAIPAPRLLITYTLP